MNTNTAPATHAADWFLVGGAWLREPDSSAVRIVCPIASGREHVVIGRGSMNDIMLSDRTISRVHAHLRVRSIYLEITDNASRNGTRVNGQVLTPGVPHRLYGGERLRLGTVDLHVVDAATFLSSTK